MAFITGPLTLQSALVRKDAFVQALSEIGMAGDLEFVVEGNHTLEGGEAAFAKGLNRRLCPTAILCSNDMTAIGVMGKCYSEKIAVPQELSVIGFDNIHLSQYILPPLTTIEMSQTELGRLAFQALLQEVRREIPNPEGTEYVLKTSFILRDSTALNPGKGRS
jgi:LacI family transcriptional regulator